MYWRDTLLLYGVVWFEQRRASRSSAQPLEACAASDIAHGGGGRMRGGAQRAKVAPDACDAICYGGRLGGSRRAGVRWIRKCQRWPLGSAVASYLAAFAPVARIVSHRAGPYSWSPRSVGCGLAPKACSSTALKRNGQTEQLRHVLLEVIGGPFCRRGARRQQCWSPPRCLATDCPGARCAQAGTG